MLPVECVFVVVTPVSCKTKQKKTVGIDFTCRIPERYPDEAPEVEVEATKGLTPKQVEELVLVAQTQVG